MLDLGRFPYINGADSKAITDTLVLDAVPSASHVIDIMYNNTSDKDVVVKADSVVARLIDTDNNTIVATVKAGGTDELLAANFTTKLASVDLYDTSGGSSLVAAGTNYEVRAYLNGEQLDEVAKIYVKSDESDAEKVTVQGVEADITDPVNATVQLPVGTNLTKLEASDVVVTTKHAKATVGDITIDTTSGTVVTFDVTAENGTAKTSYSITVTVAPKSNQAGITHLKLDGTLYAVDSTLNNQTTATDGTAITDTITLPSGTDLPTSVEVVVADETAEVSEVTLDTSTPGQVDATFTVTAQDGTVVEYAITIQ